ncbi:hypothetical protein [Endozoicomonas sp. GU-1]|uniref:hypothetical protein n=1 Tax=Endozoicomonas sp. GU-1 TaxID=3009078 RepID=UPI0022B578E2|nr:hypothetical protein [Endozoicomonas sp. GU-1]WBA82092.1 hypothetical protein O2T12_02665 [Endozoicomonas sp. GU-1]
MTKASERQPVTFSELEGWSQQQAIAVRPALLNSCQHLNRSVLTDNSPWGNYQQWQLLCKELMQTPDRQLKTFLSKTLRLSSSPPRNKACLPLITPRLFPAV